MVTETGPDGGTLLDLKADADVYVIYASLTAPAIVRCEVRLNGELVDVAYAGNGGSHSWWASGQGGLVPGTKDKRWILNAGEHLTVTANGQCAFRADFE